jgi:hypothetical protein
MSGNNDASSSPSRRVAVATVSVALIAGGGAALLAGGDDDSPGPEQTSTNTSPTTATTTAAEAPSTPRQPAGTLTATSAGPVTVGMSPAQVRRHFTAPDERIDVNLGAGGPAPQENWTWHLPDGDFTVYFDTAADGVAGFFSTTRSFDTATGATVGSAFGPIQEANSKRLRLSPIGDNGYILSVGRPGSFPALVFGAVDGRIIQIAAGNPPPAGE